VEPILKRKINATKTPSIQNAPKHENMNLSFGELWYFCDLVAKSNFSKIP
jgi:hypothetical protein